MKENEPDILKDCSEDKYTKATPKMDYSFTIRGDWEWWIWRKLKQLFKKKEDL